MAITNRGKDTWLVRIFIGRDSNGKRRNFNETVKGKKKDAQEFEIKKKSELNSGISIDHSRITVDEYLDKYFEISAKSRLKERTFEDCLEYMKRYVRSTVGTKQLSKIKPLNIQAIYTKMLEKGLAPRTIRYTHAIFSRALKQAVKWQILSSNSALMIDLPKNHRKEMKALSREEAKIFLGTAKDDKWSVIFSVALSTGMRPQEYLGLQWKNVNLVAGTVTVERALVWKRKGGGWSLQEPKTPHSRRTIPIPKSVLDELKSHRRKQLEERLKLGQAYQNKDFVFATEIGSPILLSNLARRHFKLIMKKADLPDVRLYDLRHTCATLLLLAGVNPKIVSERLGHATIALTLDTYSHVLPSMQKSATEQLEQMLYQKTGTH